MFGSGWRTGPVKYTSLEELGINVSDLKFEKLENEDNAMMRRYGNDLY
jgi:hypothetical protein